MTEATALLTGVVIATVPTPAPVNAAVFKEALARLAGGLAIISCWDGGQPRGLLVSSITGLSISPPRFLFCVQKTASSHDALLKASVCGVTILSTDQAQEAQTFAEPSLRSRRFQAEGWRLKAPEPPLYAGALSSSACRIGTRIDGGSHTILIVTAQSVQINDGEPLLSFNRAICGLSPLRS